MNLPVVLKLVNRIGVNLVHPGNEYSLVRIEWRLGPRVVVALGVHFGSDWLVDLVGLGVNLLEAQFFVYTVALFLFGADNIAQLVLTEMAVLFWLVLGYVVLDWVVWLILYRVFVVVSFW